MNIKDLKNLPNGTIFYLRYKRNNRIKTYKYIKIEDKIFLINNEKEYGVDNFYTIEFDFNIEKNLIFVENFYYTIVRVVKIEEPIQYDLIYGEKNE